MRSRTAKWPWPWPSTQKKLRAEKAEHDAALAADRQRHLAECAAREQAVLKKESQVAEAAAKLNEHLETMQTRLALGPAAA
jgi:hypothetical protein